ncbi:MAG: PQQ-dependent sugar dehydrogenase [Acidobacteria bacterium]|nr:PQQ-dependent sugar dehydrogenase [Acidobacteriota bacterium]
MRQAIRSLVAAAALAAACDPELSGADPNLVLTPVSTNIDRPVALTTAPGDPGRLYVTEQAGRVRIVENGIRFSTPFLDIQNRVSCCGERGLLSIAFHPAYQANGFFFANYTDVNGNTVVSRFRVGATNPDRAEAASETVILRIAQPFGNHNGGQLQFGPDNHLYIGTGDGGSAGDPGNRAQSVDELLGKILRLDVELEAGYRVPATNPVIGGKRTELWAIGLRNPWRFSFDTATGDLFIADVGQNQWEEVNLQPASSTGGENYGWRRMEGNHCFNPSSGCDDGSLVKPIIEYSHSEGCSVSGGYVYRGKSSYLLGKYIYGDFCTGFIRSATRDAAGSWSTALLFNAGFPISSFGQDGFGEVYVLSYNGAIYRIDDLSVRRRPARPVR